MSWGGRLHASRYYQGTESKGGTSLEVTLNGSGPGGGRSAPQLTPSSLPAHYQLTTSSLPTPGFVLVGVSATLFIGSSVGIDQDIEHCGTCPVKKCIICTIKKKKGINVLICSSVLLVKSLKQ